MYAVKTYRKAVHFYTRKVSYKNVSTRGQARKLVCFLTRLISCKIFFPRWRSDRFLILHEIDLVKKYMDLFLCEIDLVQKQNFTISGLTAESGAYTRDSSRQNCEINLIQKQTFTISGLTAESGPYTRDSSRQNVTHYHTRKASDKVFSLRGRHRTVISWRRNFPFIFVTRYYAILPNKLYNLNLCVL